jgi:hypothetical protein
VPWIATAWPVCLLFSVGNAFPGICWHCRYYPTTLQKCARDLAARSQHIMMPLATAIGSDSHMTHTLPISSFHRTFLPELMEKQLYSSSGCYTSMTWATRPIIRRDKTLLTLLWSWSSHAWSQTYHLDFLSYISQNTLFWLGSMSCVSLCPTKPN